MILYNYKIMEQDDLKPAQKSAIFTNIANIKNKLANNRKTAMTGLMLLASLAAGFAGGILGNSSGIGLSQQNQQVQRQVISNESELVSKLASEVGAGVVSVNVEAQATQQTLFGDQDVTRQSAGTGFIISADGIVITNRHVVPQGTTTVSLTLPDGTELDNVEVIGRTNENDSLDVAFLRIKDKKGKDLKPVKLGDSSKIKVGDKAIAIGNALGQFQNTVTTGVISGYGRSVEAGDESSSETLQNLFQTDAAINQGNSGGPLVNINGEVIGVNTAVAGGSAQNIGFAIPINDIQGLIKSVLKNGKLERPYLGVRYVILTDDYAYQFNLDTKRGAYIAPTESQPSILPGSPAAKAGLKEKDIIIKVNDTTVDDKNSLVSILGRFSVGDKVSLTIIRNGKEVKVDVTLEAVPSS